MYKNNISFFCLIITALGWSGLNATKNTNFLKPQTPHRTPAAILQAADPLFASIQAKMKEEAEIEAQKKAKKARKELLLAQRWKFEKEEEQARIMLEIDEARERQPFKDDFKNRKMAQKRADIARENLLHNQFKMPHNIT